MILDCGPCVVRTYRFEDAEPLPALADDSEIARYMRDIFPSPYTIDDARFWVGHNAREDASHFAIEVDGAIAGGIGYQRLTDERRFTAEFGYWLGRHYHGRGIVTAAARAVADLAFEREDLQRLEAGVYSNNLASMRVLEKIGFQREGVLHRDVFKRGEFLDRILYAKLRP